MEGSESSDIEGKSEPEEPDPVQNLCTEEEHFKYAEFCLSMSVLGM